MGYVRVEIVVILFKISLIYLLLTVKDSKKAGTLFAFLLFWATPVRLVRSVSDGIASPPLSTYVRIKIASVSDDTQFVYKLFVSGRLIGA